MIHGHKKADKNKPEEQVKQEKELSQKINIKLGQFFAIRKQPIVENKLDALIQFTTILMQLCPDITTIFNYRRELIQKIINGKQASQKAKLIGSQIKLNTKIIQGDPKSYTLWSYRQWLVLKLFQIDPSIVHKQKQLCALLLMKDEKNFHVWNYRNWTNSIQMNVDSQLQFTKSKINSNPFNFSPYHFRSKYLQFKYFNQFKGLKQQTRKQVTTYGMPKQIYDGQMQTIRTAIFLNPKQQAPWLYYSWLLHQVLPSIVLSVEPQQNNELNYIITLSLKVQNFKQIIEVQGNKQFQLQSVNTPSNKWVLRLKQKVDKQGIKAKSNISQSFIKNQFSGRRIIWSQKEDVQAIRQIFIAQEKFIKQVLESQQGQCRFAWLQLLEIYRSQFYLGTSQNKWKQIFEKVTQAFNGLKDEVKGQKYVQKQKLYWQKLNGRVSLSELQQKLLTLRKQ